MNDPTSKTQPDPPEGIEDASSGVRIDHSAMPLHPGGPTGAGAHPLPIDHSALPPGLPAPPTAQPVGGGSVSAAIDHNAVVMILNTLKTGAIRIRGTWDLEISIEQRDDKPE